MTAKKPSVISELNTIKTMLADMGAPGEVEALREENTTLLRLLYGTAARYGLVIPSKPDGVVSTVQIPLIEVPANHNLTWNGLDNSTVIVQIVETPAEDDVPSEVAGSTGEAKPEDKSDGSTSTPPSPVDLPDDGQTYSEDDFEAEVKRSQEELNK